MLLPCVSSPASLLRSSSPAPPLPSVSAAAEAYNAWEHMDGDEALAAILLAPVEPQPYLHPFVTPAWFTVAQLPALAAPPQPGSELSPRWWSDGCLGFTQ